MKIFYYNIDDAEFIDPAGERIPRCVPELFYQEMAEWRIFLRDRENRPRDISSIVGWSAAVDCDYSGDSAPMCRTPSENITPDETAGAVTVRIDAATAEFLAAVNGSRQRRAFFELYGVNAAGEREIHLEFDISARMILDPLPGTPQEVPETFATKLYVDLTVGNAAAAVSETLERELAGHASGAIFSNAEIDTQIGPYTVALTSGGGLVVSGSGASVVLSGGRIVASGANGEFLRIGDIDGSRTVSIGNGTASMEIGGANPEDIALIAPGGEVTVGGTVVATKPWANSRFARQLVTSTIDNASNAVIIQLYGGRSYVYMNDLQRLEVDSVTKTAEASYLHFRLDSDTFDPPVVISGVSYLNSATFEGGKEYLVGLFDGMAVVNEVTP